MRGLAAQPCADWGKAMTGREDAAMSAEAAVAAEGAVLRTQKERRHWTEKPGLSVEYT